MRSTTDEGAEDGLDALEIEAQRRAFFACGSVPSALIRPAARGTFSREREKEAKGQSKWL